MGQGRTEGVKRYAPGSQSQDGEEVQDVHQEAQTKASRQGLSPPGSGMGQEGQSEEGQPPQDGCCSQGEESKRHTSRGVHDDKLVRCSTGENGLDGDTAFRHCAEGGTLPWGGSTAWSCRRNAGGSLATTPVAGRRQLVMGTGHAQIACYHMATCNGDVQVLILIQLTRLPHPLPAHAHGLRRCGCGYEFEPSRLAVVECPSHAPPAARKNKVTALLLVVPDGPCQAPGCSRGGVPCCSSCPSHGRARRWRGGG